VRARLPDRVDGVGAVALAVELADQLAVVVVAELVRDLF
jgi:hypothetical protein